MIKVNNEEVKVESIEKQVEILPKDRTESDGDGKYKTIVSTKYSFCAHTAGDEDEKAYEDMMESEFSENNEDYIRSDYPATTLVYSLEAEGWYLSGVTADQWMGLEISHGTSDDYMIIECDLMEHGLLAAYLIAKQINKDNESSTEEN